MAMAITGLLLTYNEEANIGRTLERLRWLDEVVVLDSGSTDRSRAVATAFPNVRWEMRPFDAHAAQWSHGAALCRGDWILALDADFVLSPGLVEELKGWQPREGIAAWKARFVYCVAGRPLRGTLYPPKPVLFDRRVCRFVQDGHTQAIEHPGEAGWLGHPIFHDDRKPLSRWLWAQERYARLEADKLLAAPRASLRRQDRLRIMLWPAPWAALFYTLFWKGLLLDGWPGLFYALQRTYAELLLSLILLERKLEAKSKER